MKRNRNLQHWIPAALVGVALAASTGSVVALDDYLIDDFSEGNVDSVRVTDTGPSGAMVNNAIVTYDDLVGNPAGSCYVELDWPPSNGGNWEDCKIDWNTTWPGVDASVYATLDFDVKVDLANSYACEDGTYGLVQAVFQSWSSSPGWCPVGTAVVITNGTGWQHVSASLLGLNSPYTLNRLNISFAGPPPHNPTNTIKLWVDNVVLKAPTVVIPPPTLSIQLKPKPQPGLNLFACQPNGEYQRNNIRAVDTSYTWYNQSAPTTYSFTLTNFPAAGTTNYTQSFDTGASGWWAWWGLTPTFSWDSTTPDAGGRCANGSLKVSVPFAGASGEQTSIAGTFDHPRDGTQFEVLSFDIKVDPSSGPVVAGTDYGNFDGIGFVAPDWSQITVGTYTVPLSATNWTRVNLPINRSAAKLNGIQGFWFKMYSDNTHTNPLTFLLDNVQLQAAGSTFQAHMFLVPGPWSGTGASPDWNETNCVFVQIQAGGDGNAAACFRYKTNYPNSNGGTNIVSVTTNANCVAVNNVDNYFSACQLGNVTNGPVNGTWNLTFLNNSNVVFSGPGGSTNFTIPPEVLSALFANYDGTMLVYYGIDPNGTNYYGKSAVMTRAVISNLNFATSIDDHFSGQALDTNTWTVSATEPAGVFVVPAGSKGWVTWTIPDASFTLQAGTDLMNSYSWGPATLLTFLNNDHRQALLGPIYDTEMTQLDVSGGDLPTGVMIRESPTKASKGQTTVQPLAGGNYRITSFFDVYTEVSTDGGATWVAATNEPAPMTLTGTFPTNTLPPTDGQYTSGAWQGLYPNGMVITNVIQSSFDNSFPLPPDMTDPIESFGSSVTADVSVDGGATFNTYTAPGNVTVSISASGSGQRFFRLMKPGS